MWGNYALSFYRSLARRPLYAALNVAGLSIGLATFLMLMIVVRFETSFDRWVPEAAQIYRVNEVFNPPGMATQAAAASGGVILPALQTDYPQIRAGVQMMQVTGGVVAGGRLDHQEFQLINGDFFGVFDIPLAAGDKRTAIKDGGVVLSAAAAKTYFGDAAAVGRTLTVLRNGRREIYSVAGVLGDLPANSSLKIDILLPMSAADRALPGLFDNWFGAQLYTYVRFRNAEDARAVASDMPAFLRRHVTNVPPGIDLNKLMELRLVALPQLHFADASYSYSPRPGADWRVVASLGVVGALTVLIAALNYVNLSSAQAVLRAREVAIRKVVGASRGALFWQFLAEALALTLVAGLAALAIVELSLPAINALGGTALKLYDAKELIVQFGLLIVGLGFAAGLYPAVIISRFAPAPVLASAKAPGGGRMGSRVRQVLVLLQFAAATGFAICTLVVGAQTRYLREADRGFQRGGLILIDSANAPELAGRQGALQASLGRTPGVASVTIADVVPASTTVLLGSVTRPGLSGLPPSIARAVVGAGFFETYGVRTLAGRVFTPSRPEDDLGGSRSIGTPPRSVNVVLNVAATRVLGFASPTRAVGQTIQFGLDDGLANATVIGVVDDVRFMSPHDPIAPTFYLHDTKRVDSGVITVRYAGVEAPEMMDRLKASWRGVAADVPFVADTADGKLGEYYVQDERRARLFAMGAFVAVTLGCVGLFGLASFTATRRVKEVGIRKALGASSGDIVKLMVWQFLKPVVLANLLAWPLAWLVLRGWLSGFDQRIALGPTYFLTVSLGAVVLATVTVAEQAWRVARTEPARALRYE